MLTPLDRAALALVTFAGIVGAAALCSALGCMAAFGGLAERLLKGAM